MGSAVYFGLAGVQVVACAMGYIGWQMVLLGHGPVTGFFQGCFYLELAVLAFYLLKALYWLAREQAEVEHRAWMSLLRPWRSSGPVRKAGDKHDA